MRSFKKSRPEAKQPRIEVDYAVETSHRSLNALRWFNVLGLTRLVRAFDERGLMAENEAITQAERGADRAYGPRRVRSQREMKTEMERTIERFRGLLHDKDAPVKSAFASPVEFAAPGTEITDLGTFPIEHIRIVDSTAEAFGDLGFGEPHMYINDTVIPRNELSANLFVVGGLARATWDQFREVANAGIAHYEDEVTYHGRFAEREAGYYLAQAHARVAIQGAMDELFA